MNGKPSAGSKLLLGPGLEYAIRGKLGFPSFRGSSAGFVLIAETTPDKTPILLSLFQQHETCGRTTFTGENQPVVY
jgi:hypothetical protein